MKRFAVTGNEYGSAWGPDDPVGERTIFVTAPDADAAARKARRAFERINSVREVPADEGRGPLWRLLRWLRKPAAK